MKRIFLERIFAGYEIMAWAKQANASLIRVIPKDRGTVIYYLER